MPERSTGTEACAPTSTSRASVGGRVSSGGTPAEFSAFKNAFVPRDSRGSSATARGFSGCKDVVLLMTSPFPCLRISSRLSSGRARQHPDRLDAEPDRGDDGERDEE